jgi:hypothetical protein
VTVEVLGLDDPAMAEPGGALRSRPGVRPSDHVLAQRTRRAAILLARGYTAHEIAEVLQLSQRTAERTCQAARTWLRQQAERDGQELRSEAMARIAADAEEARKDREWRAIASLETLHAKLSFGGTGPAAPVPATAQLPAADFSDPNVALAEVVGMIETAATLVHCIRGDVPPDVFDAFDRLAAAVAVRRALPALPAAATATSYTPEVVEPIDPAAVAAQALHDVLAAQDEDPRWSSPSTPRVTEPPAPAPVRTTVIEEETVERRTTKVFDVERTSDGLPREHDERGFTSWAQKQAYERSGWGGGRLRRR